MIKTALHSIWLVALIFGLSVSPASIADSICYSFYSGKALNLDGNSGAIQTFHRSGTVLKLLDVSKLDPRSENYQIAKSYLDVFFIESLKNLKKDEKFIEKIKATNPLILPQSRVLLMYDEKNSGELIAGAVFVIAKDATQSLALESELGLRPNANVLDLLYPKVEVARVGIDSTRADASEKFHLLIDSIMDVVTESPSIPSFYAFTSLFHKKLYARFGYTSTILADPKSVPQMADHDAILKIDIPVKKK